MTSAAVDEFLETIVSEMHEEMVRQQAGPRTYQASPIKRRRSTKAEVEGRREALLGIVAEMQPMTVRQVFYQATVAGIVEKSEAGYSKVQTDLALMRRAGELPYDWLADNTRWQRKPRSFGSIEEALNDTAKFYRKALWADADAYVEVWLEKDALAGVIMPVTAMYDVPLMVARGYASLSFLHSAAEYIASLEVPAFIYHLGDFDPSGVNAGEKIEQTLREMAPDADITLRAHRRHALPDSAMGTSHASDEGHGHQGEGLRRHLGRVGCNRAAGPARSRRGRHPATSAPRAVRYPESGRGERKGIAQGLRAGRVMSKIDWRRAAPRKPRERHDADEGHDPFRILRRPQAAVKPAPSKSEQRRLAEEALLQWVRRDRS